ncbi:unnamed protein product [Linum tenue]|uniref:G domain-containing protein n=1 Tax=Linum tenue TaxID=586396 RepID=A0AAV0RVR5_9ROSI|nr:unnamed protein product [Linum tenue]
MSEGHNFVSEELQGAGRRISANSLECEAKEKNKCRVYREILQSFDQSHVRTEALDDLKTKILSYTPGRWVENSRGMKSSNYNVPETTTLLLVGPKGCGKSSLVNRISKVFEKGKFASERAQVSYNLLVGDGTYFLQEYMVPRDSSSVCLYDTRGLSDNTSENIEMLKQLMTKGVRNGGLILRPSDSASLIKRMKCKARQSGCRSREKRKVNFVIFVINGLEILKAMETNCERGTKYTQMIATTFNCPYLSFKDDKPIVVVTHGDLISLADRARIRVHLGDLLGVPPATQVFDIPESYDPATELAIAEMLVYALEHADKHMPLSRRGSLSEQVSYPIHA